MPDPSPAGPEGPFETEADVTRTAAVQAIFAAFDADPGVGKMRPMNQQMLDEACAAAGIELGAYDRQILAWLGNWEPQVCAVIAGLITRAHQAAPAATLGRYDKDPEALAWARGKIEATAKRYEAFADRDRAEGKDERAAEWLALADRIRCDLIGIPGGVIASFDERLPALEEHSGASAAAGRGAADQRIVSFDLMPKEPDYYFVLTEALRDFAARQRGEAEDLGEADAAARIRWAETAEDALDQIEEALTPSTIEGIVAASIDEHAEAWRAQMDAELSQPQGKDSDGDPQ